MVKLGSHFLAPSISVWNSKEDGASNFGPPYYISATYGTRVSIRTEEGTVKLTSTL